MPQYEKMVNLTKRRKENGLSQKELAVLVGVRNNAISDYERGVRFPKRQILDKLADALKCNIADII